MKNKIKLILIFFTSFILKLNLKVLYRKNFKGKKYYISVCAIFKNEGIYLKEWIEYHLLIGVQHFYLYNNFSQDDYLKILNKYINEGIVTLIDWPFEKGQMDAYNHCYIKFKDETNWIAFLDLDEFICLKKENDIKDWLVKFEIFPAIVIYWLMFGTNGKLKLDKSKLVIEQFTNCWENIRNVGKIIFNTSFEPHKIYHHHIYAKFKILGRSIRIPMINEEGRFIVNPGFEEVPSKSTIQINHYWSKSIDEYARKIEKGDIFSEQNEEIRKNMDFFYWHERFNTSESKVIWRFLVELKIRLKMDK